jgi:hypothetical protein
MSVARMAEIKKLQRCYLSSSARPQSTSVDSLERMAIDREQ